MQCIAQVCPCWDMQADKQTYILPVAVARSSSDDNAKHYVGTSGFVDDVMCMSEQRDDGITAYSHVWYWEAGVWRDSLARHAGRVVCLGGPSLLAHMRVVKLVTGQLTDTPTRGLDYSRTGHLADWSTRGLDNSCTGQVADWTTRRCHQRLCVLSFRSFGGICETASCPVRDLSSPWVD